MVTVKHYFIGLIFLATHLQGTPMDPSLFIPNWSSLTDKEQESVHRQIKGLDLAELDRQRKVIDEDELKHQNLTTFDQYEKSGSEEDRAVGLDLMRAGKVGCLIVAGGQGTRLGFNHPKGFFPVTSVKNKSLYQLFADRILAAQSLTGSTLPLAVMTSKDNHFQTLEGFEAQDYFGLDRNQVFFFSQNNLPFLDEKGQLFLESKTSLAMGPDGNASSLKQFVDSGVWSKWKEKGVEYVNYMHIDNALADPFDAELTGHHRRKQGSDVIVKCVLREDPDEKVGVLFFVDGKVGVVEYTEISDEMRYSQNASGELLHACGNIGAYSFTMDFMYEVATRYYSQFPFHKAWKSARFLQADGTSYQSKKPMAWKFEKFIFDFLPFAKDVKALLYPRKDCFAPLKNATGADSVSSVQKALLDKDRSVFQKVSGVQVEDRSFELDPAFYYPTQDLLETWKGRSLPDELYVEPHLL